MMKTYICCRIVNAEAMDEHIYKGEVLLGDRRPGFKVVYPDGYTSWSPAEAFDLAYRPVTVEECGHIIPALEGALGGG